MRAAPTDPVREAALCLIAGLAVVLVVVLAFAAPDLAALLAPERSPDR